jgi:NitT/TauT family transport system permease protein
VKGRALEGEVIPESESAAIQDESEMGATPLSALWLQVYRLLLLIALLGAWEIASGYVGEFWISKPSLIAARLVEWIGSGFILTHLSVTLQETALGFILGAGSGIVAGFVLGANPFLGKLTDPFVTAIYSLPKVALAPLFVLWFGIGMEMKVVLAATIVFFLVFYNTYAGVRDVERELLDVLRVMGARQRHLLLKVVLPGSLHWIYVGLKLSVPYALIGAVVGELVASSRGLGYLLQYSAGQFDTTGLMTTLFILMVLAMIMNEVLNRSEAVLLRWKSAGN